MRIRLALTLAEHEFARTTLARISEWIDHSPGYAGIGDEATDWRRIAKVAEESGEAIAAFTGSLGANPRKGTTHSREDVIGELLDVAVTALGAVEHLTGNQGTALGALHRHIGAVAERAGLTAEED